MKKKFITLIIAGMMTLSLAGCGNDIIVDVVKNDSDVVVNENPSPLDKQETSHTTPTVQTVAEVNPAGMPTIAKEDIKIGVLYIGGEEDTSGYTYAHEIGIQGMISNIGLSEGQVIRKNYIDDTDDKAIREALDECIKEDGCNVIIGTSWGYMEYFAEYADAYPDIYFAHGTGYLSNGKNFTNYFGRIYQARYLSGLVAGLKTKSNKIGYVSAQGIGNSECTGGVDAFAIGVEEVNPDATVYVAVTNSWFDPEKEQAASDYLIGIGCDVLAQHVDTTAPQTASEANGTWSIGYNSDMSKETPNATLTSVIWNWSAYYTAYVAGIINATYDGSDFYGGMDESLVSLTSLSSLCEDGTSEIVNEKMQEIISGKFGVFDGVLETNKGEFIGEEGKTLDDATITGGIDWYYKNVMEVDW
ncbi:MAG: BMP family ABC transporter substrate-binding protein [Eubacteriales bacterium]|nr:BMP family ABC transporter substrate-binding protein [Eubacteriales bacterium]